MSGRTKRRWTAIGVAGAFCVGLFAWFAAEGSYTNIYPEDYVGPDACRECHAEHHDENYEAWHAHSHRTMNQNPDAESVKGDFSGASIAYAGGRVVFHRDGDDYLMSIYRGGLVRHHRVTRTVGSRYVQYYIGTQIQGPEPARNRAYHTENKLPFGWSIALQRWLPEVYFDSTMYPEHLYLERPDLDYIYRTAPLHLWNTSCLRCHNTYPYVARLWKYSDEYEAQGLGWKGGFPREAIDWRGPSEPRGGVVLGPGLSALHGDQLVTVGISCESCHFGGREHAERKREIRFVPTAPKLAVRRPENGAPVASDREDPLVINSICRQCHNSDLVKYPDGSHAVNSSESLAMGAGACSSAIKCTDCHSPHEAGPPSGAPDRVDYLDACLSCHAKFADAGARARHTRHAEDVNCLDCHMPRFVSGLDTVARSHRISLPSDPRMLGAHTPNACNLCHLDRSIDWTLSALAKGWGVEIAKAGIVQGMPEADRRAPLGEVWMRSRNSYLRAAVSEAYARSPRAGERIPGLLRGLDDEIAYNRTLALITLERLLGRPVETDEYDLLAEPAFRAAKLAVMAGRLPRELEQRSQ